VTPADKLNLSGIIVTFAGSAIAMCGAYLQVNGFFAIKTREIPRQIILVLGKIREGKAMELLRIYATLGEAKREDRGKSLLGFFLVLLGFLLQTVGAGIMALALFAGGAAPKPGG